MFQAVWRRLALALFCVVVPLAGSGEAAAQVMRRAPAWPWIADLPVPQPSPSRARQHQDGLAFLIADRQTRVEPGGDTTYRRSAYQVVDRTGLEEGARLIIDFDPARDKLVLHHARVWRNGVASDRLAGARIQVLSSEDRLTTGVVTGRKSAHLEFKDVRVGDVVDYAYSWVTRDPFVPSDVYSRQHLGWGIPVGVARFRLLWPQGSRPTIARHAGAGEPKVSKAGQFDVYDWTVVDPEPIPGEEDMPNGFRARPEIEVSTLSNWAQVVDLARPLYAGHRLPVAWRDELVRLKNLPDPNLRITGAIRLVQDQLRYVSLSIGEGSYRPRSPDAVVASGYGDCKDKALLLSLLLQELGVDATPALTDADAGAGLTSAVPSLASFDHVIVRIRVGGRTYWVDATGSHEGGLFPNLSGLYYDWALPIAPGQAKLERIPRPEAPVRNTDVLERYELAAGPDAGVTLSVTTVFAGQAADYLRSELASNGVAGTEKRYLDYYAEMYPGLSVLRPLWVMDERDRNLLTLREAYLIPRSALDAGGLLTAFRINAETLDTYALPAGTARRAPLWLPWPVNKRHVIELVTPGKRPPAPPESSVEGDGFKFTSRVARAGDRLTVTYELVGLEDQLPAAKVAEHRALVSEVKDATYWDLDLTSSDGGTIGDSPAWLVVLVVIGFLAVYVGIVVAAMRLGGPVDGAYAAEGLFYPVTTVKFVVMTVATAGLYPYFWMWKCWRWIREHSDVTPSPFWRTFAAFIWLYALFARINRQAGERRLPRSLGLAAAIGFVFWGLVWNALDRADVLPEGGGLIVLASPVFILPAVIAAQRANSDRPDIVAANSRYTGLSLAALAAGAIWWGLVLLGEFAV